MTLIFAAKTGTYERDFFAGTTVQTSNNNADNDQSCKDNPCKNKNVIEIVAEHKGPDFI